MAERRRAAALTSVCLLAALLAAQPAAQDPGPASPPAAPGQGPGELPTIPYEVRIEGPLDDRLRPLLREVSESRRLADQPPASLLRLRRRAEQDVPTLLQALRSRGYYAAEVELRLDQDAEPVQVVFEVEPGPVYRFREVVLDVQPEEAPFQAPGLDQLGLEPGAPAESQRILDAEAALLERARAQAFALAELGQRRAVVDHDADVMDLTLRLALGPRARFGPVDIEGLSDVERDFVMGRLGWEEGQLITPERLAEARRALVETGLFTTARIRLAESADDAGVVPVTVELGERKHRSVGIGVRYRTDEGPGGSISLEHRNLFGDGERAELEFDASGLGYELTGDFRKPDFLRRDQALTADARLALLETDAFKTKTVGASVGFERLLAEGMTVGAALAFRAAVIEEDDDVESFGLVSLPLTFDWDRSDNLLDPTEGGRLSLANEPFADVFGHGLVFNKTLLGYSHYLQVLDRPRVVLAGRVALGSLFGAERDAVPADERFYAGGGGSVRGFGFQMAGDLDEDDDPVGGRSLLELAGEVRVNITDTIGAVAFVDAGRAFEEQVPVFDEKLFVGAGVGLRYFSPIGPLRFDVGFPLNGRDADDAFQIYISLGQAF